jgi:cytochrome c biogenesis protein CcdA
MQPPGGWPGGLTAVKIGKPSYRYVYLVLGILFVVMLIGVPFGWRPTVTYWIVVAIVVGIVLGVYSRFWGSRLRRRIAESVRRSSQDSVETIARFVLHRELVSFSYTTACLEMVKLLAAANRGGETILLWSKTPCPSIEPINEPFEAKLLNEADGAYAELDAALSGDERLMQETDERMRQLPGPFRRISRNIRMNGGRWFVGVYLFVILGQMIESWRQKSVTGLLLLQTTLLLLFLLIPFGTTLWKPQQWWAVPGGVVHRWSGLFDRKSKVHLFDRRSSVMCIYEGWRHNWVLAVADRTNSAMRYATVSEVNFLLHAWLSPLTPPTMERVVDLQ